MLDIKFLRENAELVQQKSHEKGCRVDVVRVLELDQLYRNILSQVETLRRERNELAQKTPAGKPESADLVRGREIKAELTGLETTLTETETALTVELKKIPNMPAEDVPVGFSEDANVVVYERGQKPAFSFPVKNHWQIGEARGWIDKERATKVTGTRFAYLKGDLVLLEWALMRFAMDQLTNEEVLKKLIEKHQLSVSSKPFVPVLPPLMIRTEAYDAMDRLEPSEDRYKIEGEDLWLQGSAEHVLGSMHMGELFDETQMPIRYVGFATSFRKEAGSYGKDMEGIIRMHQFNKMEMESFSVGTTGRDEHLLMVALQEHLLEQLELPYRKLLKCTFDIGKPNARGVDMDVWLPGQDKYRETHTADYMTDYQARRLNTRVRRADGSIEFIHTNDATVCSQRPLIGIIENNQQEDGSIIIPKVLRPYLGGRELL